MLVCLLGLWQGMGWAENDDTSTIGNSAKDVRTVTPEEFDNIIESKDIDYAIGIITDGKRWAYHSSVHPMYTLEATNYTVYCPEAYYDVTGNGKMDFFGYYIDKEIKANCNMYPLIVTSIDGDLIRKEGTGSHVSWATGRDGKLEYYQKDDYAKYGTLDYGFIGFKMGMYDKDGMPLLINRDAQYNFPTSIYSYKQNKIVLKAENFYYPKTTFADINGDGRKEIISFVPSKYNSSNTQLTEEEDGAIDIYRMAADGTFVADKIYVTSDTTVVKSMMLDDYTPNSGTIDKPGSGTQTATGIGYPGQGMFVRAKPAPDWNDWQEYDNITSETSQAKQVITNNGKATRAMAAQTGYVSAADINGDGMIDLYDGTNIYYNLGGNKFFKSPHKGTVYSADLTGNGLLDFIDFGNEQVDLYLSMAEDTITMTVQNPNINATYEWNIDNGTIISQNDNGSIVDVVFNRGGEQNVTVNMTLGNLMYKSEPRVVTLIPSKKGDLQFGTYLVAPIKFLDINQNGNVEVLGSIGQESGFFEYKNETYSKVRKTWNSDLGCSSYEFFIADFNHDGYPDFYYPHSKGNLFTNSGEEDSSFEYDTETFDFGFKFTEEPLIANIDFNNDGKLNFLDNSHYLYTNNGDERKFSGLGNIIGRYSYDGFFDFDRDGGLDIWKNEIDNSIQKAQTKVYFKVAGENNQFNPAGTVFYENERRYNMEGFADFNNDGYVDGYFLDHPEGQDYYNMVIVKGKPMSEWPCKETVVIPLKECTFYAGGEPSFKFVDFSNNGYLDIIVGNSFVLLMDKDFSFQKAQYETVPDYRSVDGLKSINEYHWQPLTPGAYPNGYKSSIKNEAPSVPAHVTATSVPEGLLLKWDDATDDHTPWMQMRYNVSLKIKGKTGENAFVLSPMNGLSDEAAICSGVYYRKATQLIVPKTALVNGTTYELQVQAIDLMGEHSAMTKPVEVTYNAEKMIMIDDNEHYTGLAYYGKCTNVSGNAFTIDPGEGGTVLQHSDGGIFSLKWNTPGVKTITFKDGNDVITKLVNVKLLPDLTINLPERVMLNTPLTVRVPKSFQTGKYDDFGFKESEAYKATFEKGDTIATIVFKEVGEQSLQPYVKIEKDLTLSEQFKTMVIDETMPAAEIKSVESNDKYYQVNWSTDVPSMVSKVEVSRETNRLNQFEVLDIVPVGNATYVDLTSDNRVQPQRYRIRLIAENEMQHSDYSAAHNPLHVMINKTADKKGNNLMWNAYEGLEVTSYIIMRGSSEKNLKAIATISGSQQNFTDYDAPAGVSYYAVKFEANTSAGAKGMGRVAASEDVSSNVISSEEAMPTTQATTLYAGTVESIAKLSNSQQQLHMVATILPTYVTFNKVSWSIVSGGEYASISQSGLLTAKGGKGDIVVRVVTLDGSNLSSEITIPCDVNILASDIDVRASKKTVAVGDYLLLNAVLTPKNTTMSEVTWKSENTDVATIDENGILKAISTGTVKITATTKDGSNLSAFIKITVTEASGIHGVTIEDENENTEFYDLEGRKIQTPQKGRVYITNKGQKIAF